MFKQINTINKMCVLAMSSCVLSATSAYAAYTVPAEWEPQESVWYAWPVFEPIAGKSDIPHLVQMISLIANSPSNQVVDLVVADATEEKAATKALTAAGVDVENKVRFRHIPHTDFWMRDYLVFVKDTTTNDLAVVGFEFNAWGMGAASNYFNSIAKTDGKIDEKISLLLSVPFVASSLVMEPGGLEFNGSGDLIVSEAVVLQDDRNPGVTKAQADAELKRVFDVKNIIWLPKFKYDAVTKKEVIVAESDPSYYTGMTGGGVVADDSAFYGPLPNPFPATFRPTGYEDPRFNQVVPPLTTNGHTDEYVRWVSPNTVLVADIDKSEVAGDAPDSVAVRTKQRLDKIQAILSASVNSKGEKIKVIKIPAPNEKVYYLKRGDATYDAIIGMVVTRGPDEGKMLTSYYPANKAAFLTARSYLNYVVTNDYIFMPSYAASDAVEDGLGLHQITSTAKDMKAKAVLEAYFGDSPLNKTGKIRQVMIIDNVDFVNISGGGLHCISQQMPSANH